MIEINKYELAKKIKDGDNFILLFYSNYCEKCDEQKQTLNTALKTFYGVCADDDEEFFISNYGIDVVPETRVYIRNELVFKKENLLPLNDVGILQNYDSNIS